MARAILKSAGPLRGRKLVKKLGMGSGRLRVKKERALKKGKRG
jgi:hypothetical protein